VLSYNRKKLVYVIIFLIPFLILFSRTHFLNSFKFFLLKTVEVPSQIVSIPILEAKKMLFYHRTFAEYKKKSNEVGELKARLIGLEDVLRENTRLEQLLNFKRQLIYSSVAANVIGREPSRWNASIIIDKGEREGLVQGMPVVNALGVVGKIAQVGRRQSKVILLSDPQFSLAAFVQRPREVGVVTGSLQGFCRIKFVDEDADIRVGDKIITSKLSSSFPEGLFIGEVIEVRASQRSNTQDCIIEPAVSFSQLEEVLVILSNQDSE